MSSFCREAEQHVRENVVFPNADTAFVGEAESVLDVRFTLLGGFAIPIGGTLITLRHAVPACVPCAKIGLRSGISSEGSLVEPIGRLCASFRDAPSEVVDGAERKLGVDISLSGRLVKPFCGLLIIVRYAVAQTVHCSELK